MPEILGASLYGIAEKMDDDKNAASARRLAMRLLNEWCIQRDKDEKSKQDFSALLSDDIGGICRGILDVLGVRLYIRRDGYDTAYISLPPEWQGTYGASFSKDESIILLYLYQLFIREMRNITKAVCTQTSVEDLLVVMDREKKLTSSKMKKILYRLASYNLIKLSDSKHAFSKETMITVLPSIACYMSDETMEAVLARLEAYRKESGNSERSDDGEDGPPDASD